MDNLFFHSPKKEKRERKIDLFYKKNMHMDNPAANK